MKPKPPKKKVVKVKVTKSNVLNDLNRAAKKIRDQKVKLIRDRTQKEWGTEYSGLGTARLKKEKSSSNGIPLFSMAHPPGFFDDMEEKLARRGPPYKSSKKAALERREGEIARRCKTIILPSASGKIWQDPREIEIDSFDIMDVKRICEWNDAKVIDSYCDTKDKINWCIIAKKVKLKIYRINKNNSTSFMPSEGPKEEVHCMLALLDFGEKCIDGQHLRLCHDYTGLGCRYFRVDSPNEDKIKHILNLIGKSPNQWEE